MIPFRKLLLALLFILCSAFLYANPLPADSLKQKKDSTRVAYFTNDFDKFGLLRLSLADTAITGFQNYNPLYKKNHFYATLGNFGQPYKNLLPFADLPQSGFDYGIHSFDNYLYKNDSVKYYKILKTYTNLEYVQGAKKEIFFHAVFSRNVYKSLNVGFDIRAMSSIGAYLNQKSNHVNFVATTQYFTRDRRYAVIANLRINVLKNQENGGIRYDSIYEKNIETNREIIPIYLNNAENRVKDNGFFMKHYFNLSRHATGPKDSVFYSRKHFELGRVVYSFDYDRQIFNYTGNDKKSNFYKEFLLDTIATRDSVSNTTFTNILTWTNPNFKPDRKNRLLQIEASIKHKYTQVSDHFWRKYFNQFIPFGELSFQPFKSVVLKAYGDYVIGDFNGGDMSLKTSLTQTLGKENRNAGSISINAYYAFQKPGWFYEHYLGNNFIWDTAWQQQGIISGGFAYSYKEIINAGINISRISNFVYLDTTAYPNQYHPQFAYLNVFLNENIPLGRFLFSGQFVYQSIQGTNILRLPTFIGYLNIYWTRELFKGAATFQPGISLKYNSLYYGDSYMPALRSFYLQDKKQIGDYLAADVFINLKVQRARIFAMYSHFNSAFMKSRYYDVPHYPMQDAAFRFGVTWRFHD